MKKASQLILTGLALNPQLTFGGSRLKSNPKVQRAIPLDKSLHLVMRSKHAKGTFSFKSKRLETKIFDIIQKQSERFNVKLYSYANAGNHLHMVIKVKSRRGYTGFIRSISGLIARSTLFAQRNNAKQIQFWDARPFTRIVSWGKDFTRTCAYVMQNILEAQGFINFRNRKIVNIYKKRRMLSG